MYRGVLPLVTQSPPRVYSFWTAAYTSQAHDPSEDPPAFALSSLPTVRFFLDSSRQRRRRRKAKFRKEPEKGEKSTSKMPPLGYRVMHYSQIEGSSILYKWIREPSITQGRCNRQWKDL